MLVAIFTIVVFLVAALVVVVFAAVVVFVVVVSAVECFLFFTSVGFVAFQVTLFLLYQSSSRSLN